MWQKILKGRMFMLTMVTGLGLIASPFLQAQQHIIANKDNTRPEPGRQYSSLANLSNMAITKNSGYNEIQWTPVAEQTSQKFYVEYSFDGIRFEPAGQVSWMNGTYKYRHQLNDTRPTIYRIRVEGLSNNLYYSKTFKLEGYGIPPVKIYPVNVTGNVINANAGLPVERVMIVSADGFQVFAKDLNGQRDFIPIAIPSLNKGIYLITFYGNGWLNTTRFLIS
ncbi:hypothetical protein [Terrimonas pollutisoli]|uniref:hypothetical protein n=1 Tax=Terrimonas pollutisoli TaxID=3034147 RepID=UPI0023EB2862|nr:hypothetical protein [Terrimonas sp. H1YJ31]